VLIVLDEVRLNDPNTGHFNSYIPIAPAEIEKVEILKGASSAIYGSEAVGGVVHIITKTFAAKKNQSKKQLSAQATAGEYNLANANVGGYYQQRNTAIGGGLLSNNSDGQPQRGTRGFFYNRTGSLSSKQFIRNWSIAARSSYDIRDFSAQNFYTTFLSDTAREKVNSFWNQLRVEYKKNKNDISFDAGYKAVKDHYAYNSVSVANENKSNLWQAEIIDNFHLTSKTNIVGGGQYQRKWIHSNDRGNHLINQAAAFLILDQTINHLSFSPSIRIDYHDLRATEFVPQINLSYNLQNLQLRASAGKTIRDANFTEQYNNYNKPFVSGGSIGNPSLEAERSFSYEAGVDYFIKTSWKLSTTVFRREQRNVIDWTPTPYSEMPRKENLSPTGSYALAKNISKVNTTGAELDAQYSKQFNKEQRIWATLGISWLDSKTNEPAPSFYISSHAKFLTNFNILYSTKIFKVSINGVYKHRNPQKAIAINAEIDADFVIINGKAGVFLMKKRMELFLEADNFLNNQCGDLLGSRLPGSW
jgi:iron complex outermembrane receptor protein